MVEKTMSLNEFVLTVSGPKYPHMNTLRRGQYAYNLLSQIRPDLSESIRGGPRDPFYLDSNMTEFMKWVTQNW